MKKILIPFGSGKPTNYLRAIEAAGAEGRATTQPLDFTDFDGLLLVGGGDIDPKLYGAKNEGSLSISEERDQLELTCIHSFILAGKPILGICRGIQILNVAFGGTLVQQLPRAERHIAPQGDLTHEIRCDGALRALYGRSFLANSRHHQGIGRLGRGLSPIAFSADGCVEAIIHEKLPILGVQFHPERMVGGEAIFQYFLSLCDKAR